MSILDVDYDKILEKAYHKHSQLIVSFDFDNTVFDYHKKDLDCKPIIDLLHKCNNLGFQLICHTSNYGDRLIFIKHYIKEVLNLPKVNVNLSVDRRAMYQGEKPYANIYLDDKAGLKESYERLNKLVNKITKK